MPSPSNLASNTDAHPTVIYVTGSGRSGSTLVERILGAIPGFVNVGELIDLFRRVAPQDEHCGCGERFSTCPFWSEVGQKAFGGWSTELIDETARLQRRVARQRHLPGLLRGSSTDPGNVSDDLRRYQSIYRLTYQSVLELSRARVVVDASKGPAQGLALGRSPDLDLRMVHLLRDARGVAHSWAKAGVLRPQSAEPGGALATHSYLHTATQWAAFQVAAASAASRVPSTTVKYEELMLRPEATLAGALEAIGLAPGQGGLEHVYAGSPGTPPSVDLPVSHGLSGNPGRFVVGRTALRPDVEWHSTMPRRARLAVTTLSLPVLRHYGYDIALTAKTPKARSLGDSGESTAEDADSAASAPAGPQPEIDVIVPTRGRPGLLRETVRSIVDQDYDGLLRIVIIHDQEPVDFSITEYARDGRGIEVLGNTGHPGLAGARNTAIRATSADFVATCDDDDLWHPSKIRLQIARMLADRYLLVVGAGIRLLMDEDRIVEWPGRSERIDYQTLLRNRIKELHSSTLLIRRRAYAKAGVYDELLPSSYAEDYEWLLRVSRCGDVGVVRDCLADIRKNTPSWFRERSETTAEALQYLLRRHPDLRNDRRAHARILGQIAFAQASAGHRKLAARTVITAASRWPAQAQVGLAAARLAGVEPATLLGMARKAGRGLT